ncbi:tol-pal system protein YbgF [Ovoidimarina sediminis]|uniref:tol-pal system protein YbgF n=1 Tax=Ovoidimarina sediminis TaxID=3079856 RepID=UPI0029079034|nr:tol-pal system protein YbgF [Rhodophyticola sp. MJ-SS7]MDU8946518.1 tol-pal system protein YbgF [Rhodophyticola sp. MJ-SS7]
MRRVALSFALTLVLGGAALAQDRDQTLADIRQELSVLYVEIQGLKRELSTTGSPGNLNLQGTSALDRINAMESELQRLTAATEVLTNRLNRIVQDGTNRIGDLEFRLVELEGGDISQLGETTTLGGEDANLPVADPTPPSAGAQLAMGEQADFDRAREAFESGAYENAVIQFATFTETYPGGALAAEAHYWRGRSLAAMGNTSGAARAYLESFSGNPSGAAAPLSLLELGLSLDALGQVNEACVMLGEVTSRFPGSAASTEAQVARADIGCS